jgi:hypothetical protein
VSRPAEKTVETVLGVSAFGTRLKPGVNESRKPLPEIEMRPDEGTSPVQGCGKGINVPCCKH